jgi:hypothetical protein
LPVSHSWRPLTALSADRFGSFGEAPRRAGREEGRPCGRPSAPASSTGRAWPVPSH